jgi:hypothetical protein
VGIHASVRATHFEALEPIRQGVRDNFGAFGQDVAKGLSLRHDHGSQYVSAHFQNEIKFLVSEPGGMTFGIHGPEQAVTAGSRNLTAFACHRLKSTISSPMQWNLSQGWSLLSAKAYHKPSLPPFVNVLKKFG